MRSSLVPTEFSSFDTFFFLTYSIFNIFFRPFFFGLKASGPAFLKSLTHLAIIEGVLIPCERVNFLYETSLDRL